MNFKTYDVETAKIYAGTIDVPHMWIQIGLVPVEVSQLFNANCQGYAKVICSDDEFESEDAFKSSDATLIWQEFKALWPKIELVCIVSPRPTLAAGVHYALSVIANGVGVEDLTRNRLIVKKICAAVSEETPEKN